MYRTILLAYDGSREARAALRQGADLAVLASATVHLLAVVDPGIGESLAEDASFSNRPELELNEVRAVLDEGARKLAGLGLQARTHLAAGRAVEEIWRVAREVGADLIVVGHREQSSFARWWRGSVGASLLSRAPCSVLVSVSNDAAPPQRAA
ncbi:MAG: universal stress protein [Rubrivivax sp.]|nr:universal stress protein [Burkholderiales bacterium]MCW5633509.1 universal stress protein [Rubrivivax sp.]